MGDLGDLLRTIAVTAVLCIPIGLSLWALTDCARRPSWAWALSGRGQANWLAAILVGVLVCPVGMAVCLVYLIHIRPIVAAAEEGRVPD
jgi:hypothetical protein